MSDSSNWRLRCPVPRCGSIAEGFYNAGPMAADDRCGPTAEDTKIQIVTGVTEADFEQYLQDLKEKGISFYLENRIGPDRFCAFLLENQNYHVRLCAKRGEIRVAEEPAHVSVKDFGYRAAGEGKTTLYQYGLYYDPDNNMTEKTANCGMLYIIRLCDNSLFMMDGGFLLQWNEEAIEGLWQFLRRITGTGEEGNVRISCWYFTHTHADHIDGCVKLLNRHHEQIVLERLMFNFPLYSALGGYEPSAYYLRQQAAQWYPKVRWLKLHTGQKFFLADMEIEVFYTQEDAVLPENITQFPMRDGNCMSAVIKLTVNGKTAMLLGDTNIETEAWLAQNSEPAVWKSDLVQLAHHCFNYLDTLYSWIEAPAILVPNSWGGAHQPENEPKLNGALKYMAGDQIWYEGGGTDGFTAEADGWKHMAHYPLIGGEYDGSGY